MHDATSTLDAFLSATAAKQPTPGGGSVTALVGALAAAIGEMVLNYSIGRKGLEAHSDALAVAVGQLHRAREMMLAFLAEDQVAYETMTAVRKLPADAPEKAAEQAEAVRVCIRVPQMMAATAAAVLELSERLVDIVNPWLLSDLAVCAELAMATVRCGQHNMRVNVKDVLEAADRAGIEKAMDEQLAKAVAVIRRVLPRIWSRDAKGR